jgi:hypothetical protein
MLKCQAMTFLKWIKWIILYHYNPTSLSVWSLTLIRYNFHFGYLIGIANLLHTNSTFLQDSCTTKVTLGSKIYLCLHFVTQTTHETCFSHMFCDLKKARQTLYRPGLALSVPGGWNSDKIVSHTHWPPLPQEIFLVLISVRVLFGPSVIVQLITQ